MAKSTSYLGLVLPALGEFFNRWNKPVNDNFQKVDDFANAFGAEVTAARGGSASLGGRLDASTNSDGSLKDVPEVAAARSSKVYGSGSGSVFFSLDSRIEAVDSEMQIGRQGLSAISDALAFIGNNSSGNCLISGPTNPLTFSGAIITLNGGATPVVSNINGYRNSTDINDNVTVAGSAGSYYLFLDRNPNGRLFYTIPSASGLTGIITSTNKLAKFKATGTNLVSSGVKPGHILEVNLPAGNLNLGRWTVLETAAENPIDLANDEVRIIGEFTSASTGMTANFYYPVAPTLGFTAAAPSKLFQKYSNRIYIGTCVFDGTNVTSLTPFAYEAKYTGFQAVSLTGGDFTYTVNHNIGFIPKRIHVYATQANDFSQPLEILSVAKETQGSVAISAGTQSITYTPPVLRRSIIMAFTNTTISIKNATNGIFYEDFSNNPQTTGYLYVVVER